MDDFQSLRKKYNSFDWEFYSSNYFDDEKNKLSLKKDDCWWHYLTIGLKENFLYFDIKDAKEREKESEDFDWESYRENYELDKIIFSTKYHVLWHWVNIGKINGFLYFSLNNQYESNKQKNNFDIEFYNKKYNFLNISNTKCWWHYINFGSKLGYQYFNKLDSNNSISKQNSSLVYRNNYYKQFENNILINISSLSIYSTKLKTEKYYYDIINNIINYNYNYNLYLVKYDKILNKMVHLNESDYNYLIGNKIIPDNIFYNTDFKKMDSYYQKIKNNSNNIFLFNLNIFPTDIHNLESIQTLLNNVYKCGFFNGNTYLDKLRDNSILLKKYYIFISKLNTIISSSPYLINELIVYFKKFNISGPGQIVNINLPIIQSNISLKEELEIDDNSFIIVFAKLNEQKIINFLTSLKDISNLYEGYQFLICIEDTYKNIVLYKKLIFQINKKIKLIESESCYKYINKAYICLFYNLNSNIFNKLKYSLSQYKFCICNSNNFNNSLIENSNIKFIDFDKVDLLNAYIRSLKNVNIDYSSNKFISWPIYINKVLSCINKNKINIEQNKKTINKCLFIFVEKNSTIHLYINFINLIIKLCLEYNIELVFVHWNIEKEIIEKLQESEIISLFKNINDKSLINNVNIDCIKDENSVLLFIDNLSKEYNIKVSNYINNLNIKSVFIYNNYYEFNDLENTDYRSFLFLNLLSSFKIITSEFVQKKLSFLLTNYSFSFQLPLQSSIELPYCDDLDNNDLDNETKNIDQSIIIFIPKINNVEIIINFLDIILNSFIKNKIKILVCKENEELLKQYYKMCNNLYFICTPKQINKEFTKSFNYCFIEGTSLENILLINNYLFYKVPVIYYSDNNNIKQDRKGCIIENNLKIDNFGLVNKISDINLYNKLVEDLKYLKMQSWQDYAQIVFKEIIYL